MNLIIIAAGRGSRLKPLTNKIHKALLILNGMPLIEHTLNTARHFKKILIVVGYKARDFEYLKKKYDNVELVYSKKWESTNTHESEKNHFDKLQENAYVMNADNMMNLAIIKKGMRKTTLFYTYKRKSFEWTLPLFSNGLFSFEGKGSRCLLEIYFVIYKDFKMVTESSPNFLMNLSLSPQIDISIKHMGSGISAGDLDSPFDLEKFSHNYEETFKIENTIIGFIVRIASVDSKDVKILSIDNQVINATVNDHHLIFNMESDLKRFYISNKAIIKKIRRKHA